MVQWIKVILEYIENFTGPYNYGTGLPAYEKCWSLWLLEMKLSTLARNTFSIGRGMSCNFLP